MNDNPSSESTDLDSTEPDITDLDDVEGHGLREVAAGLGAVAVLAGGGAAAATTLAAHDVPSTSAGSGHVAAASHKVGGRVAAVRHAVDKATHPTNMPPPPPGPDSQAFAADSAPQNGPWAPAPVPVAERVKHDIATTKATVHTTTTKVEDKVLSHVPPIEAAGRKVATVLDVTSTSGADGVHTASVSLRPVHPSAAAAKATGWVLVKSGEHVLTQVRLVHGAAMASWTQPSVGAGAVTISYTGDEAFAPTTRALLL